MKYRIKKNDNNTVSCVFEEEILILPELYSSMNHNTAVSIPGMRDLTDPTTIHYDVLGSVSLVEAIGDRVFGKKELYDFIFGIICAIEKIKLMGIDEKQIVKDEENIYLSLYDNSVRFICLPIDKNQVDDKRSIADMFKAISLKIKTEGAYELVGFVIEKTASADFNLDSFKEV